jgi:leader peptidase (prepilin peptidase)/N-methyltransferase
MLFFFMALYAGISLSLFPLCLFAFVLLCVSVIDAKTQEIPNGLLIFGAAVGAVWVGAGCFLPALDSPPLTDALPGILAGGLPLFVIDRLVLLLIKKDGFGFGDVKLMAMAGLYLGWELTLAAFFFAFIAGGGYGAFLLATRRAGRNEYIAFGPFLCAGALAALWFGESFLYLLNM